MNPSDQARQVGIVDSWLAQYLAGGGETDPVAGTIICDTGALVAGYYDVQFHIATTVALGDIQLRGEWRNAANSAVIHYFYVITAGADTRAIFWPNIKVAANERMRMVAGTDITGTVRVSIEAIRRA